MHRPASATPSPPLRGSTAQRRGEAAWHRRSRRERGNARALLRVAAAANLLDRHHSAQRLPREAMPDAAAGVSAARGGKAGGGKGGSIVNGGKGGGNRPRPGDWPCFLCGFQSNREFRGRCWNCEALRSASMEQAFGAYAQRQVQQQRQAAQSQQQHQPKKGNGGGASSGNRGGSSSSPSASSECRELREKLDKLQAELAATKALAARGGATTAEDEDETMEDGSDCVYATWTEDERAKRIELARGGLAYAAACHGEDSPQAAEFRETIAAIQKASREAKPFKAHRNQLERRRDELRRRQERDEAAIGKVQEEMEELQAKLDNLKAAVDERAKAIASVSDELNELVLKTLAEEGGGGGEEKKSTGPQPGAPWAAVSAAIRGLAGQAGMPADVAALLEQVHHIAEACTKAAAEASPSLRTAAQGSADGTSVPAGGAAAVDQPTVLAPQWRRGKTAAKPPSAHQPPHPSDPIAAAAVPAAGTAAAAGGATQQGGGVDEGERATGACPATPPIDGGSSSSSGG